MGNTFVFPVASFPGSPGNEATGNTKIFPAEKKAMQQQVYSIPLVSIPGCVLGMRLWF